MSAGIGMPSPVGRLHGRRSRCLLHVRADDLSIDALSGQAGMLVRSLSSNIVVGSAIMANGRLRTPSRNQPRFVALDLDGDGVLEAPALSIEESRSNLVLQPSNFGTTWTAIGSPTRTAAAITAGDVVLDLIGDTNGASADGYRQSPISGISGNAAKAFSFFWGRGPSPAAAGTRYLIDDTSAPATRGDFTVTANADGSPNVTPTVGVYLGSEFVGTWLGVRIYRVHCRTTSVTAGNTHRIDVYPAGTAVQQGNVYTGGLQFENGLSPTSYIAQTTTARTRNSDLLTYPLGILPQTLSLYARFVERGSVGVNTAGILWIGDAAGSNNYLRFASQGSFYSFTHHNGSAAVSATLAAAPAWGNVVELFGTLGADGVATLSQSINGGAAVWTVSSAQALAATFPTPTVLQVGTQPGVNLGQNLFLSVKVAAGVRTLAAMRELL